MSMFSIFEIGKSALLAARRTMDVTSHNVANAATPGYSRQEAVLEPIIQQEAPISGMGVRVSQIRRLRDFFTDSVLRNETANKESYSVQKDVMEQLQVMSGETSDSGLRSAIEGFWSAWQELSIDPGSVPARASLAERGRSLIDMFQHMDGQIESLQADLDANIDVNIQRVNTLSEQVVAMNDEIRRAVARQEPIGDLMDKRDVLLDEITQITGATVTRVNDATQSVKVSIGGFPVVDRDVFYKIGVNHTSPMQYTWIDKSGASQPMSYMGGRLGGLTTAREDLAGTFKQDLEGLLSDIVTTVNNQYANPAFPIVPPPVPAQFFTVGDPADYLGSTQVAPQIIANPSAISVWDGNPATPGNGLNGLAIANLMESGPVNSWTGIVGQLGSRGQKIKSGFETEELLVKEIQNRRDSISGVSVDEEMANLIREQHAFNAASRLITTADELIDTVINRMGAGR